MSSEAAPLRLSRRRTLVLLAAGVAGVASLVLVLPTFADVPATWDRVVEGDTRWLVAALGFEALSFLGHIVLFRSVVRGASDRIGLRASTEITLAGHVATRLFASAGAGGVALTAWALRRSGLGRAEVASRMTTFLVLLYSVYMLALVVGGLGLAVGLLPGAAPLAMTLVPAAFGAAVIALALLLPRLAAPLAAAAARGRRVGRLAPAAVAIGDGVDGARALARRGDAGVAGAILWWAGDIAVLWACFHAFGAPPEVTVVVVAYFVGMLANTLPLPGGVGGVDGGMVAALVAFGVDPGLAVVSVLAYRGFAFWLPILPGALAWLGLRRTVAGWSDVDAPVAAPAAAPPVAPAPLALAA